MDTEEFRRSNLCQQLGAILASDAMIKAMEIVRRIPIQVPPPVNGVHYDLTCSRHLFEMIGANSTIERLKHLAKPYSKEEDDRSKEVQKAVDRPEWEDGIVETLPVFAQEAIKKMQSQQ